KLRRAIRRRDATGSYVALLDWLPRIDAEVPAATVRDFKAAAGDPELDRQIGALESALFASERDPTRWSPRELLRHVTAARRNLHPHGGRRDKSGLPRHLNPDGTSHARSYASRRPAR